jgi:hypothetical protein
MSLQFVATLRARAQSEVESRASLSPAPKVTPPIDPTALALGQLPLFSSLSPTRVAELAQACSVRVFRRGEFIVEQGGHDHALFVLLSGRALTLRTDNQGREVFLTLMASGALVGELPLVDGLGHSSTARCESTCHVLVIPAPAIAAELAQNHGLAEALLKLLSRNSFQVTDWQWFFQAACAVGTTDSPSLAARKVIWRMTRSR